LGCFAVKLSTKAGNQMTAYFMGHLKLSQRIKRLATLATIIYTPAKVLKINSEIFAGKPERR
jgi:hypothetical protein